MIDLISRKYNLCRQCIMLFFGLALIMAACTNNPQETQLPIDDEPATDSLPGTLLDYLGNNNYPDDFWKAAIPESCNVNRSILDSAAKFISDSRLEIHSFLVARNGRLVFERYGWSTGSNAEDLITEPHQVLPDERNRVHSTTKSVISTLIGIAVGEKLLPGVREPVIPYFTEYQPIDAMSPEKESITIEDLLTMRSGLEYNGTTDDVLMYESFDPAKVMLSRPVVNTPVGSIWNYSSGESEILAALVRKVTNKTPLEYANEKLFTPLGISDVVWEASGNGTHHGGWGIQLTPREMARFGELYRNRGVWEGKQIVPAEWTDSATVARCRTTHNGSYGYHFWIPELPGFFGTRGAFGRNIYISRELGLVVVLTANLPIPVANDILDRLVRNFVVPAVTGIIPDTGVTEITTLTINITGITEDYNGRQIYIAVREGAVECSPNPEGAVQTGSGSVIDGKCRISIPYLSEGVYTVCGFLDNDGNNEPGPGDIFGLLSVFVSGYTEESSDFSGWMILDDIR